MTRQSDVADENGSPFSPCSVCPTPPWDHPDPEDDDEDEDDDDSDDDDDEDEEPEWIL